MMAIVQAHRHISKQIQTGGLFNEISYYIHEV